MTSRTLSGETYTLAYDVENRLLEIKFDKCYNLYQVKRIYGSGDFTSGLDLFQLYGICAGWIYPLDWGGDGKTWAGELWME
jgi:hypothetical protein